MRLNQQLIKWISAPLFVICILGLFACSKDDNNDDNNGSGVFTADTESPAANSVYLELESSDNNTFELAVKAKDLSNVYGVYFNLDFNGQFVEYVSGSEGNFLNNGSSTFFFATGKANTVVVGVTRQADGGSASGSGTLCKLTFRGIADGQSRFDFSRNAVVDPNNNETSGVTWYGGLATIVM